MKTEIGSIELFELISNIISRGQKTKDMSNPNGIGSNLSLTHSHARTHTNTATATI